jgi:hypothetical protein
MSDPGAPGSSSGIDGQADILGPMLILDGADDEALHLAALVLAPSGVTPPPIRVQGQDVPLVPRLTYPRATLWRARFRLPMASGAGYRWNGRFYPVAADVSGDMRLAFVSCNGEEHGDLDRDEAERNAMWARLRADHEARPLGLLLHGGDQIYADEATRDHPLTEDWPDRTPRAASAVELDDLRGHLRRKFLDRYARLLAMPDFAWLAARVPSLAQWDDHDICDGWGSLPSRLTDSAVGQTLFSVAREAALAFQHGTCDGDLPARFDDTSGRHLGWHVDLPGLRILAPDLRSGRTRHKVMSDAAWQALETQADRPAKGRTVLISTVPLLGPRLSWLEAAMMLVPRMQKYEDDLRDQWQSRAHRAAWQRMLRAALRIATAPGQSLTVVSGEIHLAARAEMATGNGAAPLHQLVASGIAHRPPPRIWPRLLDLLSRVGQAPLPGHPIRFRPLPGGRRRYLAERNYLVIERQGAAWSARWHLENSGVTPALPL